MATGSNCPCISASILRPASSFASFTVGRVRCMTKYSSVIFVITLILYQNYTESDRPAVVAADLHGPQRHGEPVIEMAVPFFVLTAVPADRCPDEPLVHV